MPLLTCNIRRGKPARGDTKTRQVEELENVTDNTAKVAEHWAGKIWFVAETKERQMIKKRISEGQEMYLLQFRLEDYRGNSLNDFITNYRYIKINDTHNSTLVQYLTQSINIAIKYCQRNVTTYHFW